MFEFQRKTQATMICISACKLQKLHKTNVTDLYIYCVTFLVHGQDNFSGAKEGNKESLLVL